MADTTEKINIIDLEINQDEALKSLSDLEKQIVETKSEITDLKKANKELASSEGDNAKATETNNKKIEARKVAVKKLSTEYNAQQKVVKDVLQTNTRELGTLEKLTIKNKELRKELRELNLETEEGTARQKEIVAEIDANTDVIKDNSDAFVQDKINVGNYQSALDGLPGSLGKATSGFKGLLAQAKAFIASPIGLILLAVAGAVKVLSAAFGKSQKLMDAVKVKTKQLGASVDVLTDRVSNGLENAWHRLRGEHDKVVKSSKSLREELREEAAAAKELTEAEIRLKDLNVGLLTQTAELRKEREKAKLATRDETLSITERLAAEDRAIAVDKELLDVEMNAAKERARISQERVEMGKSTREELEENARLQAEVIDLETAYYTRSKELATERASLVNQLSAAQKTARDKEIEIENSRLEALETQKKKEAELAQAQADKIKKDAQDLQEFVDRELEIWAIRNQSAIDNNSTLTDSLIEEENERLTLLEEQRIAAEDLAFENELISKQEHELALLQIHDDIANAKADIDARYEEQRTKIEADAKKIREALAKEEAAAKVAFAQGFFGTIAGLASENTIAYKGATSALIAIDTYKAAMSAFSAMASIPVVGPALGVVAAAGATAMGLDSIRKVWAVDETSGSSSVSAVSGGDSVSTTSVSASSVTSTGGVVERDLSSGTDIPKTVTEKVPVLVTDQVTADQANIKEIESLASN